ncbi:hypothetical protein SDC9_65854 [bioreactor metagenome]|uniref:Uncharacterized protein n=1 Tax=bioreactor metagenome TaxID=1076179 RepID=A0A644XT90_9ZZZZ|nr:hypothetical protein [Sphaerochaeta associata]
MIEMLEPSAYPIALICEALDENGAMMGFLFSTKRGASLPMIVLRMESSLIFMALSWETRNPGSSSSLDVPFSSSAAASMR